MHMPIDILTLQDGQDIVKAVNTINERIESLNELLNNIAQQYHKFAINLENIKLLVDMDKPIIHEYKRMKDQIYYFESEDYQQEIINKYNEEIRKKINLNSQRINNKKKNKMPTSSKSTTKSKTKGKTSKKSGYSKKK